MISNRRNSFTLIELLVVLALVAILSVVVVMTLNPAELLKQARDSNRLSDLATINTALNLFSTDVIGGFMGTSTVVYVSLPSTTSTCSNLGLPSLPTGYTYNCVTSANLRNTDGTGWIPVNFNRISSNSPISQLPIDPTNTTSTRLYYTYTPGGSWELNATVEASKNKLGGSNDLVSKDGGSSPSQYEIGNNLNLNPIETGDTSLVGYWNFEEGPNATSTDRSGYGNHGTWYGTSTQQQHYAAGKVGQYAGSFNGSSDYIEGGNGSSLDLGSVGSIGVWVRSSIVNPTTFHGIIGKGAGGAPSQYSYLIDWYNSSTKYLNCAISNGTTEQWTTKSDSEMGLGWRYIAYVFTGTNYYVYLDGVSVASGSQTISAQNVSATLKIGSLSTAAAFPWFGYIDDLRIYRRALSGAEILSLYNSTK